MASPRFENGRPLAVRARTLGDVGAIGGWDTGLWAIVPTIAVSLLFWFVLRAILRADRSERAAQAKIEAELDAQALAAARRDAGLPPGSDPAR